MDTPDSSASPGAEPLAVGEGLEVRSLAIPEIKLFRAERREDRRGYVMPTYNKAFFASLGIHTDFVHENHCFSPRRGTVRGFHYQLPPSGQAKLIRITGGRLLDVNVDLRKGSPTYLKWLGIEWPIPEAEAILLDRDLHRTRFSQLSQFFPYPAG